MPWTGLFPSDELKAGQARLVEVGSLRLCVVNCKGQLHVIDDTCTHEDYSLSEGDVWEEECEIECPKHASSFSLVSGEPTTLPATRPVKVYPGRVEEGMIQADLPDLEQQ
jgi:3-phenylpropionate/trans-cinnamate dioxygenase ferredoxin subunit